MTSPSEGAASAGGGPLGPGLAADPSRAQGPPQAAAARPAARVEDPRAVRGGAGGSGAGSDDPVDLIARLFASEGLADYLGEAVSQASHMLQAGALAEQEGADDALIAAALLHDVGHFTGTVTGRELMRGTDNRHAEAGAAWLSQWFGPEVTEPVRLHVAAKRYLCACVPGYAAALSAASACTLGVQGGPMPESEFAEFEANLHAAAACRVRRWDDAAKDPDAVTPPFDHFRPVLRRLIWQFGSPGSRPGRRPVP
ncbi:MAG: phosphonate degradation HD-domain oxygenase [Streptosporangiaceae bacterium]